MAVDTGALLPEASGECAGVQRDGDADEGARIFMAADVAVEGGGKEEREGEGAAGAEKKRSRIAGKYWAQRSRHTPVPAPTYPCTCPDPCT